MTKGRVLMAYKSADDFPFYCSECGDELKHYEEGQEGYICPCGAILEGYGYAYATD